MLLMAMSTPSAFTIRMWNLTSYTCEKVANSHDSPFLCGVSVAEPTKSTFISVVANGTIRLWNLDNFRKATIKTMTVDKNLVSMGKVWAIRSDRVVSGNVSNNNLNAFSLTKENDNYNFILLQTLKGHTGYIRGVKSLNNTGNTRCD